jgi:hypothetical protein
MKDKATSNVELLPNRRRCENLFELRFYQGPGSLRNPISAIVDFTGEGRWSLLIDADENVHKLLQFQGSFASKYERDGSGEFFNLRFCDPLLCAGLRNIRIEFDV